MGIAQIALDPPPCQTGKPGKKCPKPSWQALTPPGKRGKKAPQTILASLCTPPFTGNAYMEITHLKKGNNTFQKREITHFKKGASLTCTMGVG